MALDIGKESCEHTIFTILANEIFTGNFNALLFKFVMNPLQNIFSLIVLLNKVCLNGDRLRLLGFKLLNVTLNHDGVSEAVTSQDFLHSANAFKFSLLHDTNTVTNALSDVS